MQQSYIKTYQLIIFFLLIAFSSVFGQTNPREQNAKDDLKKIYDAGELVVALRDRDWVYKEKGQKQFNHALAEEFAKYLGVKLKIVITPDFSKYWVDANGENKPDSAYTPPWFNNFDLACDIITETDKRSNKVAIIGFIPEAQTLIGNKNTKISSLADLNKLKGATIKCSIHEDLLKKEGIKNYYYVNKAENMISDVVSRKADYSISSDALYELPKYPNLEIKLITGRTKKMGWALRKNQKELNQKVKEFINQSKENGLIDSLFKQQTGITLTEAENYLTIYHESQQTGHLPFVFYNVKDGLPQEEVQAIFQDKLGYMWFGTKAGAVKYNGRTMSIFDKTSGLPGNSVYDIAQDTSGTIYFATSKGIATLHDHKFESILNDKPFKNICIDKHNNKWFSGEVGIFIKTNKSEQIYVNNIFPELPKIINSISQANNSDTIYLATGKGIFKILLSEKKLIQVTDEYCHSLCIDRDNNIWYSVNSGLFYSKLSSLSKTEPGKNLNSNLGLTQIIIENIKQSSDDNIWLFSENNAYQVLSSKQKAIVYCKNNGLKNYKILSFCDDNEGNLWFGFAGGIQKLTNRSLRIFYPEKLDNYIYSITQDTKGRLWICSDNGIYYYKDTLNKFSPVTLGLHKTSIIQNLPNRNILVADKNAIFELDVNTLKIIRKNIFKQNLHDLSKIFISSKNEIFLCNSRNTYYLKQFDSNPILIENKQISNINSLVEYEDKLIGGNNLGLCSFSNNNFKLLHQLDFKVNTLCKNDAKLWLGTDKGLGVYQHDKVILLDLNLPSNVVNAIYPTKNLNHLWIGTNKGIAYFNISTSQIEFILDSKDGLSGDEIVRNGLFIDSNELLWIGTYHGLTFFDFSKKNIREFAPVCQIENISLNRKKLKKTRYNFDYDENSFIFEMTGISFKDEGSVEYEFHLQGVSSNYGYIIQKEPNAYYSNLSPGEYIFSFRARGKDNIWSESKTFKFEINKPFWTSFWFIAVVIIIFIIIFVIIIFRITNWRTKKLKYETEKLEEIVEKRTSEIVEQNKEIQIKNADLKQKQEEILAQSENLKKANEKILQTNNTLENQKEELSSALTHLKETQSQLVHSEKMASLGQLIAGIAHEVNTPLGAIKSSVATISATQELTLTELPELIYKLSKERITDFKNLISRSLNSRKRLTSREERKLRKSIRSQLEDNNVKEASNIADTLIDMNIYNDIESFIPLFKNNNNDLILKVAYNMSMQKMNSENIKIAVENASKVVFALKNYSRHDEQETAVKTNISESIETVLTLYHNKLKHGVEVFTQYDEVLQTLCYPDELNQVWTNIIHNAIQAMNNKGTLKITVEKVNDYISVKFLDTGVGIPEKIQERIFEPFFTTKPAGEGTGLGLDIVKKIVEKHNGKITVESKLNEGATFNVLLPMIVNQTQT